MEIMVYAKVGGRKHFLGTYESLENIQSEVDDVIETNGKIHWTPFIYFLMNGEEYKLYLEDEK